MDEVVKVGSQQAAKFLRLLGSHRAVGLDARRLVHFIDGFQDAVHVASLTLRMVLLCRPPL